MPSSHKPSDAENGNPDKGLKKGIRNGEFLKNPQDAEQQSYAKY